MESTTDNPFPKEICLETEIFIWFQNIADYFFFLFSIFGSVFNLLVIYFALKLFRQKEETIHLFVISMSLGDLMLTMFSYPIETLSRVQNDFLEGNHLLCAPTHFFNWLGLAISGFSLVFLNVDKLIYFRWPLSYDRFMSKRRASLLCLFIWSISLGFVCYVWIFKIVYVSDDCALYMSDPDANAYKFFVIVFCVFPIASALFLSLYLFYLTRQRFSGRVVVASNRSNVSFKKKLKSLAFIFSTTAWTSFSLLPYRIFCLCRIFVIHFDTTNCATKSILNWTAWILIYLLMANSMVNPMISAFIYKPYRRLLKGLFKKRR